MEPLASVNGIPPYSTLSSGSEDVGRDDAAKSRSKSRSAELPVDRIDEVDSLPFALTGIPSGTAAESSGGDFKSQLHGLAQAPSAESAPPLASSDVHASDAPEGTHEVRLAPHPEVPGLVQLQVIDAETLEVQHTIPSDERIDLALRYQEQAVNPLGAEIDMQG